MNELPLVGTGVVMVSSVLDRCEPCIIAKHACDPHPTIPHRVYNILELVHANLCGPFPTQSPHGEQHALIMLDDGSNYNAVECMWTKDQVFEWFKVVIVHWELQTGKKLKFTQIDRGGDFVSGPFRAWLEERGVVHQITCPYSHQQNRKAECIVHTLEDHAMANLYGAGLSSSYWADAFNVLVLPQMSVLLRLSLGACLLTSLLNATNLTCLIFAFSAVMALLVYLLSFSVKSIPTAAERLESFLSNHNTRNTNRT